MWMHASPQQLLISAKSDKPRLSQKRPRVQEKLQQNAKKQASTVRSQCVVNIAYVRAGRGGTNPTLSAKNPTAKKPAKRARVVQQMIDAIFFRYTPLVSAGYAY